MFGCSIIHKHLRDWFSVMLWRFLSFLTLFSGIWSFQLYWFSHFISYTKESYSRFNYFFTQIEKGGHFVKDLTETDLRISSSESKFWINFDLLYHFGKVLACRIWKWWEVKGHGKAFWDICNFHSFYLIKLHETSKYE